MEFIEVLNMNKLKIVILIIIILTSLVIAQETEKEFNIVGYKYLYEEIKTTVPVYCERTIDVAAQSYKNGTITKDSSYTESYKCDTKIITELGKQRGIEIDNKEINNPYINVKDNTLIQWNVPTGDRNLEEYPDCTEIEKSKGVCSETDLLKELTEKVSLQ